MKPDNSTSPKILLVDSSVREQTSLALVASDETVRSTENFRAQELPVLIEKFLQQESVDPKTLDSLAVVVNDGSVTGIRIGVATINTLAWVWRKPVLKCPSTDFEAAIKYLLEDRDLRRQIFITESV